MYRGFSAVLLAVSLLAGSLLAQSPATAPAFEATEVHVSAAATNPFSLVSGGLLRAGRYDLRKATMVDLIRIAWGVDSGKVVGGPAWLEFDRFDVSAKAPPSTPPEIINLMLRSLLADRFKLVLHEDTRPLPAFALLAGKGSPKLRAAADGSATSGCQSQPVPGSASYICRNVTMQGFAQSLRRMAGDYLTEPVVDSTGVAGSWDFELNWTPRSRALEARDEGMTVFDAIDKQLGLKLERRQIPTSVLVVDRVNETPSANSPGVAQILPPRLLKFEVATLKLSAPDEKLSYKLYPGGRLEMHAFVMKDLIAEAWDIDWNHMDERIAGAPKWIDSRRFDIVARTAPGTDAPRGTGFMDDDLRLMLRALLTERFRISSHFENRPVPAYTLTALKPKLTKADPSNRSNCTQGDIAADELRNKNLALSRFIQCRNVTIGQFAQQLRNLDPGQFPTNDVADETGIKGSWDFTVNYSRRSLLQNGAAAETARQLAGSTAAASDPSGFLSLTDAVRSQLGLKLELHKRPLPVLVIETIDEKPAEN